MRKLISCSLFTGLAFGCYSVEPCVFGCGENNVYSNIFRQNGRFYKVFIGSFSKEKSILRISDSDGDTVAFWYLNKKEQKTNSTLNKLAQKWVALYEEAMLKSDSLVIVKLEEDMNKCAVDMGAELGSGTWF